MPNTARDELYIANPEASSSVVTQVTPMGNRQPGVLELLTQWESTGWGGLKTPCEETSSPQISTWKRWTAESEFTISFLKRDGC